MLCCVCAGCLSLSLLFIFILVSCFYVSLFIAQIRINVIGLRNKQSCQLNRELLFTPKQNRKKMVKIL